jgi:hypothetical protein
MVQSDALYTRTLHAWGEFIKRQSHPARRKGNVKVPKKSHLGSWNKTFMPQGKFSLAFL